MKASVTLTIVLLATSAHASGAAPTALRDAALFHDEQRIRSLINKEVHAEQLGDPEAEDQAIIAISKATDPSSKIPVSH